MERRNCRDGAGAGRLWRDGSLGGSGCRRSGVSLSCSTGRLADAAMRTANADSAPVRCRCWLGTIMGGRATGGQNGPVAGGGGVLFAKEGGGGQLRCLGKKNGWVFRG